jgi:tetratricopeptide (TPR) repeat protein
VGDEGRRDAEREEARAIFEEAGHDYGLALYWWSVGWDAWNGCRAVDTAETCMRALRYLERAGASHGRLAMSVRERLLASYVFGPMRVDDAIAEIRALGMGERGQLATAWERNALGRLYALRGDFDVARELAAGARQAYHDAGVLVTAGALSMSEAWIELRAGKVAAAERVLRAGLELLERIGDRNFHPTVAVSLADVLYGQERYDEAGHWCARARAMTEPHDAVNFVFIDAIQGCLLARDGRLDEGEARARHAVELTESIDFFEGRALARRYLAEVLAVAGRTPEAEELAAEALAIRDAKGDVTGAVRTRQIFERLGLEVM